MFNLILRPQTDWNKHFSRYRIWNHWPQDEFEAWNVLLSRNSRDNSFLLYCVIYMGSINIVFILQSVYTISVREQQKQFCWLILTIKRHIIPITWTVNDSAEMRKKDKQAKLCGHSPLGYYSQSFMSISSEVCISLDRN